MASRLSSVILQRLSLISFGTLIGILLLECCIRLTKRAPEFATLNFDADYGSFDMVDNLALLYEPRPLTADINAQGFRGPLRNFERDRLVKTRALIIGDSIGAGYCAGRHSIAYDWLFSSIVEQKLRPTVEMINIAVPGYSLQQELERLKVRGLKFNPNLVIVAYCMNDDVTWGESSELQNLMPKSSYSIFSTQLSDLERFLMNNSHLFRTVRFIVDSTLKRNYNIPASLDSQFPTRVHNLFQQLSILGKSHQFRTLVLIFPHLHWQKSDGSYPIGQQHQVVLDAARQVKLDAIDLLPIFLEKSAGNLANIRGRCISMHPDEKGHQIVADVIIDYLKQNQLTGQ